MVHELWACATSCAHIRSWVWSYYMYACVVCVGPAVDRVRGRLQGVDLILLTRVSI